MTGVSCGAGGARTSMRHVSKLERLLGSGRTSSRTYSTTKVLSSVSFTFVEDEEVLLVIMSCAARIPGCSPIF